MLGIVVAVAGIHAAVAHPGEPTSWPPALALAGVALYLAGLAATRRSLRFAAPWSRWTTAAVVLATVPIGAVANAGAHLAVVVAVVAAMVLAAGDVTPRHRDRPVDPPGRAPEPPRWHGNVRP